MDSFGFYPDNGPRGLKAVDGAGHTRALDADLNRVHTRQVVVDTAHFDTSYSIDGNHLQAFFAPMKHVSGLKLVNCVVPKYLGPMSHAILTATMESGDRYYLHAFAPQTSTLAAIGRVFRTSLEDDSKRATTSSFSSPWFQALTIKTADVGFTVLEYYTSSEDAENVRNVELDVTQFDNLQYTIRIDYSDGLISNFWDADALGAPSFTNGLWHFSQESTSVHSKYGCPYLCVSDNANVLLATPGRGNMIDRAECILSAPQTKYDTDGKALPPQLAKTHVHLGENVIRSITVLQDGSGYEPNTVQEVVVSNAFGSGSGAVAKAVIDDSGRVSYCYLEDAGSGYLQAGTSARVDAPNSGGRDATLAVVIARHGVRRVSVTSGGDSYASPPSAHVTGLRSTERQSTSSLSLDASGAGVLQNYNQDVTARAELLVVTDATAVTAVRIIDAGEGYRPSLPPALNDTLCVLMQDSNTRVITAPYQVTKWFKTPLTTLDQLRITVRCSDGTLYPISSGRCVFVFDAYCANG